MGTKNNPGTFDCYTKAEPDEPMFVLLARDPDASFLIRVWCELKRIRGGYSAPKLQEAERCAIDCEEWLNSRFER